MAASLLRLAATAARVPVVRAAAAPRALAPVMMAQRAPAARAAAFHASAVRSSEHQEETYEEFTDRFEKEFDSVQDVFELQRNLNNCFAYDLVPSVEVLTAALKAARRVNDYPTAVRVFEGIKAKVENPDQYKAYLESLEPLRQELGVALREELYPQE
jgi:cytochrome c oxidase subunit 5a